MLLQDFTFNKDVKNAHTFLDPIIFREVMPRQIGGEIKKTPFMSYRMRATGHIFR